MLLNSVLFDSNSNAKSKTSPTIISTSYLVTWSQEASPGVKTRVVALDFGAVEFDALVRDIHTATADIDVCLLVNNAGIAHEVC